MSAAKGSKKNAGTPAAPISAPPTTVAAGAATPAGDAPETFVPAIESADPRRRMIAKVVLVAAWIYVAALWLLALDQTFHWGIF